MSQYRPFEAKTPSEIQTNTQQEGSQNRDIIRSSAMYKVPTDLVKHEEYIEKKIQQCLRAGKSHYDIDEQVESHSGTSEIKTKVDKYIERSSRNTFTDKVLNHANQLFNPNIKRSLHAEINQRLSDIVYFPKEEDVATSNHQESFHQRWQTIKNLHVNKDYDKLPRHTQDFQSLDSKQFLTDEGQEIELRITGNRGLQSIEDKKNEIKANLKIEMSTLIDRGLNESVINRIKLIARPGREYNCHGFTFTGGAAWVRKAEDVPKILNDNQYHVTEQPQPGDIIVYKNPTTSDITHTGIVSNTEIINGKTTVTEVVSKWEEHGLYRHAPDDTLSRYGNWEIYHSNRAEGSLLQIKV